MCCVSHINGSKRSYHTPLGFFAIEYIHNVEKTLNKQLAYVNTLREEKFSIDLHTFSIYALH